jgi:hypothetical protein
VVFDDFELGTNGNYIMTGSGSARVGEWYSRSGTPYYTNTYSVSGSLSFQANMYPTSTHYVEAALPANTRDFFISWWMYIPSGDKIPGEGTPDTTNWKVVWVLGSSTTDDDITLPTMLDTSTLITANGSPYTKYISLDFQKGEWKRVWVWTKGGYSNDGECHYWELDSTNAVVQRVNDNNVTLMYDGGIREKVHINGYGRTTQNCHPGYDDVYIAAGANARARVEIGNSSTYNNCTALAISPSTSWSGSSITAKCNVGGLPSGDAWYLFVLDSSNVASSGYKVKD